MRQQQQEGQIEAEVTTNSPIDSIETVKESAKQQDVFQVAAGSFQVRGSVYELPLMSIPSILLKVCTEIHDFILSVCLVHQSGAVTPTACD